CGYCGRVPRGLMSPIVIPLTCHRRFQQWVRSGVMRGVLEALALDVKARGALDIREAFIDGSFAPAKKGAPKSENQRSKVPHHTTCRWLPPSWRSFPHS